MRGSSVRTAILCGGLACFTLFVCSSPAHAEDGAVDKLVESGIIDWNIALIGMLTTVAVMFGLSAIVNLDKPLNEAIVDLPRQAVKALGRLSRSLPWWGQHKKEKKRKKKKKKKETEETKVTTVTEGGTGKDMAVTGEYGPLAVCFLAVLFSYHTGVLADRLSDTYVDDLSTFVGEREVLLLDFDGLDDDERKAAMFDIVYGDTKQAAKLVLHLNRLCPEQREVLQRKKTAAYYNAKNYVVWDRVSKERLLYAQRKISIARAWCLVGTAVFVLFMLRLVLKSGKYLLIQLDICQSRRTKKRRKSTSEELEWASRRARPWLCTLLYLAPILAVFVGLYAWQDHEREMDGKVFGIYKVETEGKVPPPFGKHRPMPLRRDGE